MDGNTIQKSIKNGSLSSIINMQRIREKTSSVLTSPTSVTEFPSREWFKSTLTLITKEQSERQLSSLLDYFD
jgi:hypothetical protein